MSEARASRKVEFDVRERSIGAIIGSLLLTIVLVAVGFIPIFVGIASERRDPGGGYIILGGLTGIAHLILGIIMLVEVLFIVGTGRGKTIGRMAHSVGRIGFMPGLDFFLGLVAIAFGTLYMLAFTQTIADMPRVPSYALGYTTDGWLGIWIVWVSVILGCFFWAIWMDTVLGRDPRRKIDAAPTSSDPTAEDE